MSQRSTSVTQSVKNLGWQVTLAGLGVNLALGILDSWSVIRKGLPDDWIDIQKSLPYSIACLVFCLVMVPAGRLQDKIGPRIVASIGGILVGVGMILAGIFTTPLGVMVGFGLFAGAGFGFGYASATPPAVKWFPAARTGMIAGIVVSGFGLASVYTAALDLMADRDVWHAAVSHHAGSRVPDRGRRPRPTLDSAAQGVCSAGFARPHCRRRRRQEGGIHGQGDAGHVPVLLAMVHVRLRRGRA